MSGRASFRAALSFARLLRFISSGFAISSTNCFVVSLSFSRNRSANSSRSFISCNLSRSSRASSSSSSATRAASLASSCFLRKTASPCSSSLPSSSCSFFRNFFDFFSSSRFSFFLLGLSISCSSSSNETSWNCSFFLRTCRVSFSSFLRFKASVFCFRGRRA